MFFSKTKKTFPATLAALEVWSGSLPNDPENDEPYEYVKRSDTTFLLCATFDAEETEDLYENYYDYAVREKTYTQLVGGSSWLHPAGNYCFDRTVEFRPVAE